MKVINLIMCILLSYKICNSNGQYLNDNSTYSTDSNVTVENDNDILSRKRRTLIYPKSPNLLLIFGMGTPLQLDRESVIVGVFTKMIYYMPDNLTYFTEPGVYYARAAKSRWSMYKVLEKAAEIYGFGGKECILRAICEAAFTPFDFDHGLFGQLVQTFLTPSSTNEEHNEYEDQEYHAAEKLGKNVGEHCHILYPECKRSILDVFSTTSLR